MDIIIQTLQVYPWFSVVTATIALFSAISAVTPTPKQNSTLGKVYKVVDFLALNILKAKQK
jgi:hypothetical protein